MSIPSLTPQEFSPRRPRNSSRQATVPAQQFAPAPEKYRQISKPSRVVRIGPVPTAIPPFEDERVQALSVPRSPVVQLHPATPEAPLITDYPPLPTPQSSKTKPVLPDTETLVRRARAEQRRQLEQNLITIVRIVGQACLEVEMGLRGCQQLQGWVAPEVVEKMRLRYSLRQAVKYAQPRPKHVRVTGARLHETAFGDYEASATVQVGPRVRAIAMKLQQRYNRWQVIELEIG